jgi:hypothetical protein
MWPDGHGPLASGEELVQRDLPEPGGATPLAKPIKLVFDARRASVPVALTGLPELLDHGRKSFPVVRQPPLPERVPRIDNEVLRRGRPLLLA